MIAVNLRKTPLAISAALLASCAANPGPVLNKATDKLISYFDAKQELAETLQMQLGGPTAGSPRNEYYSYRLVAINGPAYQLGSVLEVNNSLDLITRKCIIEEEVLPFERWSTMPKWTAGSVLDTGLGIPSPFQNVISKAQVSVDVGAKLTSSSIYQIQDIGQRFLARDEMRNFTRSGECGEYLSTLSEPVVFVRGIIYGRETLKSAKGFEGDLDLNVVSDESGLLNLTYNNSGAYELSENEVVPKFAIMAKIVPAQTARNGINVRGFTRRTAVSSSEPADPERAAELKCQLSGLCGDDAVSDPRSNSEIETSDRGIVSAADARRSRPARAPSRASSTARRTFSWPTRPNFGVVPLTDEEVSQIEAQSPENE